MRVVITADTVDQLNALRHAALGAGLECSPGDDVAFADLAARLREAPAELILVGVGADPDAALGLIQTISAQWDVPVWAVGSSSDSEQMILLLRAGAREFLDENKLGVDLAVALERLRSVGPVSTGAHGQAIAVIGVAPGGGVTTVATNLAFALAQKHPGEVVLAELGSSVPELALDLDLDPPHTVADLFRDWQRMDPKMVRQALVHHPAGIQVLAYGPETLAATTAPSGAMRQAVRLLRAAFPLAVLDLGHSAGASELEAMTLADSVVVVARLDVPSLRLSHRFISHLKDKGVAPQKIRVVGNRYGQRGQLGWKKAEQALGTHVLVWIPDDPGTLNRALNDGRPLVQMARRARITRRFDVLAQHLNGRTQGGA
jgi:pilus assembly protein CpaE